MSADLRECPFPLLGIRPPYDRFTPCSPAMLEQDAATPGFVSALEARAIAAVEALAPWVAALRRTAPSAPVTLFMRGGDLKAALRLASACPLIKVRAVVIADEPIEAQLRASACHPPAVAFPGELAEWLVLTRRDLPVAVVQSVQSKMSIGCARRSAPRGGGGRPWKHRYAASCRVPIRRPAQMAQALRPPSARGVDAVGGACTGVARVAGRRAGFGRIDPTSPGPGPFVDRPLCSPAAGRYACCDSRNGRLGVVGRPVPRERPPVLTDFRIAC